MRIGTNKTRALLAPAIAAVAVLTSGVATTPALASNNPQPSLADTRAATAKYHDVSVAEADGYVGDGDECLPEMGIHYINFAQIGQMDPLKPDALLYKPSGDGLRLVGVEWIAIDADQDVTTDNNPVPSLFGQRFDGPMEGHFPGNPVHYDLHAYIWQANPDGVFSTWNRNVRC
jgi:hypothetical protein